MSNYYEVLQNNFSWAAKVLEITIMILANRILASCVKQHQSSLTSKWARFHKMHISTHRLPNTCARTRTHIHTHTQTQTHTQSFCTFSSAFLSWGQKRPSNRCGTKEQRALYLFASALSVWPFLSPSFCLPLLPTSYSALCSPQRMSAMKWKARDITTPSV